MTTKDSKAKAAPKAKAKTFEQGREEVRADVLRLLDALIVRTRGGFNGLGHGDVSQLRKQVLEL